MPTHIATHQISLHGLSGAVFWCLLSGLVFYVLGFATVDWERTKPGRFSSTEYSQGLWAACAVQTGHYGTQDWFKATQAMCVIGLVCLLASMLCISLYMFVHSTGMSKSKVILAFTILAFLAVVFMLVGFALFGSKHNQGDLHWSFAFAVIGGIFTLIAAILGIAQMKSSNVIS